MADTQQRDDVANVNQHQTMTQFQLRLARISQRLSSLTVQLKTKISNHPSLSSVDIKSVLKKVLARSARNIGIFLVVYMVFVAFLAIPFFQTHVLFLHAIRLPRFVDFNVPERYGLAPNRTFNFKIQTPDNQHLGAWFILSDSYYHSLPNTRIPKDNITERIQEALAQRPVILYLHGNGPTRAFSSRVQQYQAFSTRLDANVLAIDYRGFADSTGGEGPSQKGLTVDAISAFEWLIQNGKKEEDILVVGHSLGTGVAGQLGKKLGVDGRKCKGIVLLAPFSSIPAVVGSYRLFGIFPLLGPFSLIPGAASLFKRGIRNPFDTLQALSDITTPRILIAHAENDRVIPHAQSDILFDELIKPYLHDHDERTSDLVQNSWGKIDMSQRPLGTYLYPPTLTLPSKLHYSEGKGNILDLDLQRKANTTIIPNFGRVSEFESNEDAKRKFVLVKTQVGEHDYVGVQEGVVDIVGKMFGIDRNAF